MYSKDIEEKLMNVFIPSLSTKTNRQNFFYLSKLSNDLTDLYAVLLYIVVNITVSYCMLFSNICSIRKNHNYLWIFANRHFTNSHAYAPERVVLRSTLPPL